MTEYAFIGACSALSTSSASATFYGAFGAEGALTGANTSEAAAQLKARGGFTLSKLHVHVPTNTRLTACAIKVRKNGADTALAVSVAAGQTGVFSDLTNTAVFADGDLYGYSIATGSGGGGLMVAAVSAQLETSGQASVQQASLGALATPISRALPFAGSIPNAGASSILGVRAMEAATLSNLQVVVTSNASSGYTVALTKNGTATSQAVSVGAGLTGLFEDTVNTTAVAAGDYYAASNSTPSGSTTFTALAVKYEGAVANRTPVAAGINITSLGAGASRYSGLWGRSLASSSEASVQTPAPRDATLSSLSTFVRANTSTTSAALTLRVNGVAGNQVVSVPAGTTGLFQDLTHTDAVVAGDLVSTMMTGVTTGAIDVAWIGALVEIAAYTPILNDTTLYYGERTTPGDSSTVLLKNIPGLVAENSPEIVSWRTSGVTAIGGGAASNLGGLLATNTATATARTPNPTLGSITNLSTITLPASTYTFTVTAVGVDGSEASCTVTYEVVPNAFNIGDANGFDIISSRLATDTGGYDWLLSAGADFGSRILIFQNIIPAGTSRTTVRYADATRPSRMRGLDIYNCQRLDIEGMGIGGGQNNKVMIRNASVDCHVYGAYPLGASAADVLPSNSGSIAAAKFAGVTDCSVEDSYFLYAGRGCEVGDNNTGCRFLNNTVRYYYGDGNAIGASSDSEVSGNLYIAPMRPDGSGDHIDGMQFSDNVTLTRPVFTNNIFVQADGNAGSIGMHNGSTVAVDPIVKNIVFVQRAARVMNLGRMSGAQVSDISCFLTGSGVINQSSSVGNDNIYNGVIDLIAVAAGSSGSNALSRVFMTGTIPAPVTTWTHTDNVDLDVFYSAVHQFAFSDPGDNHVPIWNAMGTRTHDFTGVLAAPDAFERLNNYYAGSDPDVIGSTDGFDYAAATPAQIKAHVLDVLTPATGGALDLGGGQTVGAIDLTGALKS